MNEKKECSILHAIMVKKKVSLYISSSSHINENWVIIKAYRAPRPNLLLSQGHQICLSTILNFIKSSIRAFSGPKIAKCCVSCSQPSPNPQWLLRLLVPYSYFCFAEEKFFAIRELCRAAGEGMSIYFFVGNRQTV